MSIDDSSDILAPIVGLVIGIVLFFFGLKSLSQKRLIENIPTSKIRSIAMGLVEVFGRAVPFDKNILFSPFSNTECIYYKYWIEKWVKSGKNHHWRTIKKGKSKSPFLLDDDTGTVLIDPAGANIDINSVSYRSDVGNDPPNIVKNFLISQNLNYEGLFGINHKMRYREAVIVPNRQLYVIGTATDNPFQLEGSAQQSSDDIMIHKGKGKIYYISQKSEKNVIKSYQIKAIVGLFGGAIFIVIFFNILLKMVQNI